MSADPADQFPVMTTMSRAARDVLAERQRQVAPPPRDLRETNDGARRAPAGEGHSAGGDDRYVNRELARAAIAYAIASLDTSPAWGPEFWWPRGWGLSSFKPKDARRDLVRAAALLIAEIERLDRAAAAPRGSDEARRQRQADKRHVAEKPPAISEAAFAALAPEERLGDQPVEAQYREEMAVVVRVLDEFLNGNARGPDRKTGFVLLIFPFGDDSGRCNFASNGANRRDIVTLFKEMIARFEGQPEITGRA